MRALVTGCAGFIGSNLTDRLLAEGHEVIGMERFSNYYSRELKERNIASARQSPSFTLVEADIAEMEEFPDVDVVFHLSAQAGVRASWGKSFDIYTRDNIQATQRLLEFYKDRDLDKFVYSSTSSVYGDSELPFREDRMLRPISPYGVSKLAAENLCYLYWKNYGLPTVALRYFTVYGPRQRPDMGINRFANAILKGDLITIYGDGEQTRDFTFVDDVVRANILAAQSGVSGEAFNIAGGKRISVNDLIALISEKAGRPAKVEHVGKEKGDAAHTLADASKAERMLGWTAEVGIEEGIERSVEWFRGLL